MLSPGNARFRNGAARGPHLKSLAHNFAANQTVVRRHSAAIRIMTIRPLHASAVENSTPRAHGRTRTEQMNLRMTAVSLASPQYSVYGPSQGFGLAGQCRGHPQRPPLSLVLDFCGKLGRDWSLVVGAGFATNPPSMCSLARSPLRRASRRY